MPGAARRSKWRESRPRPLRAAGPGEHDGTPRSGRASRETKASLFHPPSPWRRARRACGGNSPPQPPPPTGVPRAISGCNPTCQSSSIAIQCIRFYSYEHLAIVFHFLFSFLCLFGETPPAEKTGLIAAATTAWRHMHTAEKRKSICRCDEIRRTRCA